MESVGWLPVSPKLPSAASMSAVSGGSNTPREAGADKLVRSFGEMLDRAIADLEAQQAEVQELNRRFLAGELPDVHQLMIASEKALLGVELAVQVRNKAIEAYQEIMRMQI